MRAAKQLTARIARWTVLALSTSFFLVFSRIISEHAICPIGGFELFFTSLFKTGFTVAGLLSGMSLIFLIMSAISILFRRAYCGYICPMGAVQELFQWAGRILLPKKLRALKLPAKLDRALRWVKYPVLLSFIAGAAITGTHWMLPGDPFIVLTNFLNRGGIASSWGRFPFAVVFFCSILAFAFLLGRGFCRYICPAGAWYAILSKLSPSHVVRDEACCVSCGRCSKACPMGIDVASEKKVMSAECIGCAECVNTCPVQGALSFRAAPGAVPPAMVPLATAAAFAGSVAFSASVAPAHGQHPQGGVPGAWNQRPDGQNKALNGEKHDSAPSKGTVSFGGCSNCSGCGICSIVSSSGTVG